MMRSERVCATDQVVNWVKSEIQSGRLRVGDKLPKEADMAEMLGVGRSSLREGMKILNTYGVVESRQGEGTFRVDHVAKNVFEFLGFLPNQENTAYFLELRRVCRRRASGGAPRLQLGKRGGAESTDGAFLI